MTHRTGVATGVAAATWLCLAASCPAGPGRPAHFGRSAGHIPAVHPSNGLQVIIHEDQLPIAHVNMWFHVGSKAKPGRTGLAHLFEHLMFQGSKTLRGVLQVRQTAGAISWAAGEWHHIV